MNSSHKSLQEIVLLIGTPDYEGVLSTIKAADGIYKIKRLSSKPENWQSIVELFDDFKVVCAIIKFNEHTYRQILSEEYETVSNFLIDKIREVPHLLFIHEELYSGEKHSTEKVVRQHNTDYEKYLRTMPGYDPAHRHHLGDSVLYDFNYDQEDEFEKIDDESRILVNKFLGDCGLKVLTYKTNAQLTVLASDFIADTVDGLMFRLYVPSKRIWANETGKLIQLFQEYLAQIGHFSVRLDQRKTGSGTVFEFFSKEESQRQDNNGEHSLATEFQEFAKLLELSIYKPQEAEAILSLKQVDQQEISRIVARYAKEAKRLQTDLKHEREQKVLSIRHRLESELIDELPPNIEAHYLEGLIDAAVPAISGLDSVLGSSSKPLQMSAEHRGSVTVNFRPQFVEAFNSVVSQEIEGNVQLSNQDMHIMELIHEYAPDRELELSSAVRELADDSAPHADRLSSKQKLKVFLSSIGDAAKGVAVDVLTSYIEKKMGL